jgi:hypothetical protein
MRLKTTLVWSQALELQVKSHNPETEFHAEVRRMRTEMPRCICSNPRSAFGGIKSMDVVVPVKRGDFKVEVRLRTVGKPEEELAVLRSHLGLRLPSRSKTVRM